jgi:hypothetical protein
MVLFVLWTLLVYYCGHDQVKAPVIGREVAFHDANFLLKKAGYYLWFEDTDDKLRLRIGKGGKMGHGY